MKLLESVGLSHRLTNKPGEMSGGEKQRVSIARALANSPEIIVADEPTGNLDSKSGAQVLDILKDLNKKEGKTLLIVTHDQKIGNMAKKKIRIMDGKITTSAP